MGSRTVKQSSAPDRARLQKHGSCKTLCDLSGDFGARANVARHAAYAIEDIATAMQKFDADDFEGAAGRAMLQQLRTLAGVVMSAVNDDKDTVPAMQARAKCMDEAIHA
jgi:hypothetical protein